MVIADGDAQDTYNNSNKFRADSKGEHERNNFSDIKISNIKSLSVMKQKENDTGHKIIPSNNTKKDSAIANIYPFSPYCTKQFDNKSNVERHLKSVHQKMTEYTCVNQNQKTLSNLKLTQILRWVI